MYDDYDFEYEFTNDYTYDLDEYYAQDVEIDEDYARDTQDYDALAYRHYAWYNLDTSHSTRMLAQKRLVTVTLDIMCYDDLELEDINWNDILELQPGEQVECKIQERDINW